MLILFNNTTSHTQHVYKFQNPRHDSSWEIFDTNFPTSYIGVRDKQKELEMCPKYTDAPASCLEKTTGLFLTLLQSQIFHIKLKHTTIGRNR